MPCGGSESGKGAKNGREGGWAEPQAAALRNLVQADRKLWCKAHGILCEAEMASNALTALGHWLGWPRESKASV